MNRFEFGLAEPSDDAVLRNLMAATPSGGKVVVSFRREPSYFDAAVVEGPFRQTIVARDRESGCVAAVGDRSVRQRFVNGVPTPIGFLSNLRILPQYRNQSILARGFRHLRCLHRDGRARLYLSTIAKGNQVAASALTTGRACLPRYHYAGDYHTAVIPLRKNPPLKKGGRGDSNPSREDQIPCYPPFSKGEAGRNGVFVREAKPEDVSRLIEFLNQSGQVRQFFPVYGVADFFSASGSFRDLRESDILLTFRGSEIVGTLACWNQIAFRQTVVESYSTAVSWVRPLVNSWAQLRGAVTLPKAGEPFRFVSGALPLVKNDDPQIFEPLLQAARSNVSDPRAEYLLIGLHERDPLRPVVEKYQTTIYSVGVYYVCWEEGESLRAQLDDRPPYLELGCL
ncbi:MAG: hypothetical protein FJ145_14930 [Deltaproteobacteria bacterium]|nr:hypothetical protein [Deltaproteobacteria bacterium]